MSKLPQAFIDRMKAHFGDEFDAFIHSLDRPVTTSIRLNEAKISTVKELEVAVSPLSFGEGPGVRKIAWTENGYYLSERPSFTFDPLFHAGAYYVQESSSMFLEQAFKAIPFIDNPIRVLDLCAAPGGKSTHLLSLMNADSLLVSNEPIANRNHILRQNLSRWGNSNVIVTQNKASDFAKMGAFFDVILIDAPCSGEGLFRKDKNAIAEWSEANVTMCAERQRDILSNIVQCLKPNGYLIYSTCTFEGAENLDNINYLVKEHGMESISIPGADNYTPELTPVSDGNAKGYAFYPHHTIGEGFFISLLMKPGPPPKPPEGGLNSHQPNLYLSPLQGVWGSGKDKTTTDLLPYLNQFINNAEQYTVLKHQPYYNILPTIFLRDYKTLSQHLYIRNAGISAGEIKGRDFIPAHELSLYQGFKKEFPSAELDLKTAISYLKAETISIPTDHKGWMTVRYRGANLGFVKALPNRINNYFPKEWRILKSQP
jgi:16S rRNA C967 or C1407 C5-methylase (RsmB/RsmF family)/NOL1/NOP2/fmu family ribosome biogenesis protein